MNTSSNAFLNRGLKGGKKTAPCRKDGHLPARPPGLFMSCTEPQNNHVYEKPPTAAGTGKAQGLLSIMGARGQDAEPRFI